MSLLTMPMDAASYRNHFMDRLYESPDYDYLRNGEQITDMSSSYLPDIITKSYQQIGEYVSEIPMTANTGSQAHLRRTHHNEFRSRIRPAIFKGKMPSIAHDPESHIQMEREKQALSEHRNRPKTPVILQPVQVMSFRRPKSRRHKSQRMTKSAPEILQMRASDQTNSLSVNSWVRGQSQPSQLTVSLPKLSRESNSRLDDLVRSQTMMEPPKLKPAYTSRGMKAKSAITKHVKPQVQGLRLSQQNSAAQRAEKRTQKVVTVEDQEITITAQSLQRKQTETILDMVEQAQNDGKRPCRHDNSMHCTICPPGSAAKNIQSRQYRQKAARHLPNLQGSNQNKENTRLSASHQEKKALIVQLPNITYSRSNTPASALVDRSRAPCNTRSNTPGSALLDKTQHRLGDQTFSTLFIN